MIQQLRDYLVEYNLAAIQKLAAQNKRLLSFLTALTYDPNPLLAWRAITALGVAAGEIANHDPEYVRVHLRRLMWLLNDESGGIGWRAPEAMGEMIRSRPDLFAEFIPIVISILDMEVEDAPPFRAGALWAIGRLVQVVPLEGKSTLALILPCLDDPDPQVQGMAIWCISQMGANIDVPNWDELLQNQKPVQFYQDGQILELTFAQLAILGKH